MLSAPENRFNDDFRAFLQSLDGSPTEPRLATSLLSMHLRLYSAATGSVVK
jgi:hypothetical protein